MMKKIGLTVGALMSTIALSGQSHAGDSKVPLTIAPVEDSWEVSLAPYVWFSGLSGSTALTGLPTADIDASFSDIWDNLEVASFIALEADKGKFHSFLDFQYVKLGADANVAGGVDLDIDVEQIRLELGLGYRVYTSDRTSVVAYGAVMYNYIDDSIKAGRLSLGATQRWVDPAVGIRVKHQLNEHWQLNFTGEYGGFGVSSDETWQLLGAVGYQINDSWSLIGGYRHQAIDYSQGGFLYDTETSGPFLGARYTF